MKQYNFEQGSDEWFKIRLGKLTASKAQAISAGGAGLDTLVFEKVAELLTGKMKPPYTSIDIERGNEMELVARNSYELDSVDLVKQVGFVELDEFVGCSPDGLVGDKGLVEIKCKNDANFAKYLYDRKVDPAHMWQMQMQMLVTERQWCDYVVFNDNFENSTVITRIERNKKDIEKLKVGLELGVTKIKGILDKIKNAK